MDLGSVGCKDGTWMELDGCVRLLALVLVVLNLPFYYQSVSSLVTWSKIYFGSFSYQL
jgi:hypothetical protein